MVARDLTFILRILLGRNNTSTKNNVAHTIVNNKNSGHCRLIYGKNLRKSFQSRNLSQTLMKFIINRMN